ncbi:MAG: peptide deformylase [Spirochaetaceae bacterium]|jgi:peptide deformylase|nr:peptide deformylase [Spirochaetaceae bacterium]
MEVTLIGNDLLRQKSLPVKEFNEELKDTCVQMLQIMHEKRGIGLAGPQVGLLKRLFVVHIENDAPRVFINPVIIGTSEETAVLEEGCLSIPGVWEDVKRPKKIMVQAQNELGKVYRIETSGILARVILHEYDHLEGVLFVDRLSQEKKDKLLAKYEKLKSKSAAKKNG